MAKDNFGKTTVHVDIGNGHTVEIKTKQSSKEQLGRIQKAQQGSNQVINPNIQKLGKMAGTLWLGGSTIKLKTGGRKFLV